jgi:hypothetical protein
LIEINFIAMLFAWLTQLGRLSHTRLHWINEELVLTMGSAWQKAVLRDHRSFPNSHSHPSITP